MLGNALAARKPINPALLQCFPISQQSRCVGCVGFFQRPQNTVLWADPPVVGFQEGDGPVTGPCAYSPSCSLATHSRALPIRLSLPAGHRHQAPCSAGGAPAREVAQPHHPPRDRDGRWRVAYYERTVRLLSDR